MIENTDHDFSFYGYEQFVELIDNAAVYFVSVLEVRYLLQVKYKPMI